jgi:predicted ATPase
MIKSIRLQNFFGFQDCTINLEKGENVLVGINGSGKSNFFKAIRLLKEGVAGKDGLVKLIMQDWGGFSVLKNYNTSQKENVKVEFTLDPNVVKAFGFKFKEPIIYSITIKGIGTGNNYSLDESISIHRTDENFIYLDFKNGSGHLLERFEEAGRFKLIKYSNFNEQELVLRTIFEPDRFYAQSTIKESIQEINIYSPFETSLNSSIRKSVIPTLEDKLAGDGGNLPVVLFNLKHKERNAFKKIEESLRQVNENFDEIDFDQRSIGRIELLLVEKGLNKSTSILHVSDGTLRFLCLMAIFYNPKRGSVICIDEPELGLHPDMINTLRLAIEHAAETSQIIISTHSPHLLDYFELENIRVFEKDDNNSTEVSQFTDEDFKGWYETFNPGQMWRAGDIGGNRW